MWHAPKQRRHQLFTRDSSRSSLPNLAAATHSIIDRSRKTPPARRPFRTGRTYVQIWGPRPGNLLRKKTILYLCKLRRPNLKRVTTSYQNQFLLGGRGKTRRRRWRRGGRKERRRRGWLAPATARFVIDMCFSVVQLWIGPGLRSRAPFQPVEEGAYKQFICIYFGLAGTQSR